MTAQGPLVTVRQEEHEDFAAMAAVHTAAFGGTTEAKLVALLRSSGNLRLSLVAEIEGRVVGHVAFSPVAVEGSPGAAPGLGLAPVGVLPEFQRHGIGSRLIRAALEWCQQAAVGYVVLLGNPRFYSRFGFTPARERGIQNEYTTGDAFQLLELRPGAAPAPGALVRYGREFAEAGVDAGPPPRRDV